MNGHKWKLGWEEDQNHQLTQSFHSLPRTSLSKNKTKIPFYPFSQGRQKTEQRSYTNLACLVSQSSFCKGCVLRDKTQHLLDMVQIIQQESVKYPSKPHTSHFCLRVGEFQSFWYLKCKSYKPASIARRQVSIILVVYFVSPWGRQKE